jgi:tRNA(fMet)-specific endonuclease VapC
MMQRADTSAGIRAQLEGLGTRIGYNDTLIAGTAVSRGLILVTHTVGEFARVSGLHIEDWDAVP